MRRHVGAQTLAGFRHGDLSRRRASRIRAHLADCARCSELNSDLGGVTTLLAAAQPPPMPEHLTARIQIALATEAARRAAQTAAGAAAAGAAASGAGTGAAGTDGSAGPASPRGGRSPRHERPARGRPLLPGLSSPLALRAAAAAAAAVVVAGGVYEIVQHAGGSSSPSSSSKTGASESNPARASGPLIESGPASGGLRYLYNGREISITPVPAPVSLTPANLRGEVSRELASRGAVRTGRPAAAAPAPAGTGSGRAAGSALEGCLNRIAAGQQVLLVEIGRYQAAPATVIVTSAAGTGPEQVWVVGAGCSAARGDVLAHVALSTGG